MKKLCCNCRYLSATNVEFFCVFDLDNKLLITNPYNSTCKYFTRLPFQIGTEDR